MIEPVLLTIAYGLLDLLTRAKGITGYIGNPDTSYWFGSSGLRYGLLYQASQKKKKEKK
jgi:hypothetical protein